MTDRITEKMLESLCAEINRVTKSPEATYTKKDGKFVPNIGNYHISHAYGGVELIRMSTEGGGVRTVSPNGHASKRELYNFMQAFLAGHHVAYEAGEEWKPC